MFFKIFIAIFIISLFLTLPHVHPYSFFFYNNTVNTQGQAPPIQLNSPTYTFTCAYLSRTSRVALTYQDFESFPSGWNNIGGTWTIVTGGYKGNALQGYDDDTGIGGTSDFYWTTRINTYASYNVTVKVNIPGGQVFAGIILLNSARTSLYEISIDTGGGFSIWLFTPQSGWSSLDTSNFAFTGNTWYIIYLVFTRSGGINNFNAYLYDKNLNLLATVSTSDNTFLPYYVGLDVDRVGGTVYIAKFDDFEIGTGNLRFVNINNMQTGMQAQIYDNLGNLTSQGTATTSSLSLNVLSDVVIGTGVDGRIILKYPSGINCLIYNNPTSSVILGGDTYSLTTFTMTISIDSTRTQASNNFKISPNANNITQTIAIMISNVDTQTYYALLNLTSYSFATGLYANITLVSSSTSSTSIRIVNSAVSTSITSEIAITGSNNYIYVSAYYTGSGRTSTLNLVLQYCTVAGGNGACVQYPITLVINS